MEAKSLLDNQKQIVLTGPPGTGKTYTAKKLAEKKMGLEQFQENSDHIYEKGAWDIVQFHPAYNYDDFVVGIRVETKDDKIAYKSKNGILARMAKVAAAPANKEKKFVLIVDEINRANLAAVLGELIYALEYRGEKIKLPYPDEDGLHTLAIPENLYLIGTMNTADRSIGHIDYAVRRRFAFLPLKPNEEAIQQNSQGDETRSVAIRLFNDVSEIFTKDNLLSPDYRTEDVQIGHSYFMAENCEQLGFKIKYQVVPLLKEYVADGILTEGARDKIDAIEKEADKFLLSSDKSNGDSG